MNDYEVIIGIEVHAELLTKTKAYCSCTTEFQGDPNTHCCPVCMGLPGTLPVLNEDVVKLAVKTGLATNCSITKYSKQDRKNYFYPDTPKAYQISQFDLPLCQNGYLDINIDDNKKRIGITRIHIEEDAGKLIHDEFTGNTLVDFNRCGVPLIEIVTEPDFRNAEEVTEFMKTLKSILEYLEVCDCKMQEGSLRCDVNLSVRKIGQKEFGTRTETKNLNSFKAITRCIEFETKRQIEELEKGNKIYQETRRWDDAKEIGYQMRVKENSDDYRYFPEPDLVPLEISEEYIDNILKSMPEMPNTRKERYIKEYMLSLYDATQITASKDIANYFDKAVKVCNNPKIVANWIMVEITRKLNEDDIRIDEIKITPEELGNLILLIDKGVISSAIAKKVFEEMYLSGDKAENIVKEKGLTQITDENEIKKIVEKVVSDNEQSVIDYRAGKDRALGFLVGQIMKESKGKANPKIINDMLLEILK